MNEPRGIFHKSNRRVIGMCSVFVVGAVLYGYDGTYFAGVLEMPTFKRAVGQPDGNGGYIISSGDQSLYASIVQVGELVGSLAAGFIGDRFGRKLTLHAAISLVTLGTILQLIATIKPLLVVGRLVLGAGVGIVSNCVTLYLSEIPPANIRGTLVSSWQLMLAIGQVVGAGIAQGTKDYSSSFSYRFPIAFNIAICLIIFVGLFFVVESPRWLLSKDRIDEATHALARINKSDPNYDPNSEVAVILDAKAVETKESGAESRWGDLFKGRQRYKLLGAFGILCCQQIGGIQFIFSYGTVFFASIDVGDAFLITLICDIVEVIGVIASFFIINRFGRRPLLLTTTSFLAALMIVMGALGTVSNRSKAMNSAIASMIIIYVFVFNLAWGGLAWTIATELAGGKNRSKIMALSTAGFWVCAWAVTFTLPYLYNPESAGLGPMVGFIYAGGCIIGWLFVFFCIPETLGRTLEEINYMIELGVPTRAWPQYQASIGGAPAEQWKAESKEGGGRAGQNKGRFLEHGEPPKADGGFDLQRVESD